VPVCGGALVLQDHEHMSYASLIGSILRQLKAPKGDNRLQFCPSPRSEFHNMSSTTCRHKPGAGHQYVTESSVVVGGISCCRRTGLAGIRRKWRLVERVARPRINGHRSRAVARPLQPLLDDTISHLSKSSYVTCTDH